MNFKRIFYFLLLGIIALSFSSCFEIIEEINVSNNGSGDVTFTLNLSQSKTKLSSIMLLDSVNGYKVPSEKELRGEINNAVVYLRKTNGISNVKSTADFDNFIASVSFSFKNVSNINNLTKSILKDQESKVFNNSSYNYDPASGLFVRKYEQFGSARTEFNKLKNADKEVFKTADYVSIYRFQSPVAKMNNSKAVVSKSKKAVMLKTSVLDIINGKANLSNQIQLFK